ncbi:MAG: hypothetical protein AAGJ82_10975, partial [Bacteroidota bacterium]
MTSSLNTTKQLLTILFISIFCFGITSCDDEEMADIAPIEEEEEFESAWWSSYEVRTPEGDIYYLSVTEEIPENFDASTAIELGFEQTVIAVGDHP